ncbi:glycosyltransferase family 4 protein [Microtetraspora niveoalba]|uniref:glycosyltransferase family 4 protein n=1 Tax=Microtetraspora niveoalba TaxID=46175 RepID=UPI000A008766|nr:glycosyltransferase family 4 protein [Microtetraspora niveoalba]
MRIRYMLLHAYGMGGTIRTVINQANAMAARGHDVELVSAVRRRDEPQFPIDPRVRLVPLTDQREQASGYRARLAARRGRVVPPGEYKSDWFTRGVERAVADYLAGVWDGVLVTTRPGLNLLAARYAPDGAIRVAQEHMNMASHRPDVRAEIVRTYRTFDAVVVLTHGDRLEYERAVPGARVLRIPNAVHEHGGVRPGPRGKVVLAAGRLTEQKGFDLLVPAFARVVAEHPDWQLRIFGTGPGEAGLRALIEELHLYNHVFLMGRTDRLDDELAKASAFVLSSRFEGLPMVMIEAMSHGTPIVSFDCPTGPADVLTDGVDGLLVPPGDVPALADALARVIGDRALRERLGSAALAGAAPYTREAVTPQWEALFEDLARRRRGAAGVSRAARPGDPPAPGFRRPRRVDRAAAGGGRAPVPAARRANRDPRHGG